MFLLLTHLVSSTKEYKGVLGSKISYSGSESCLIHDAIFLKIGSCISITSGVSVLLRDSFFYNCGNNAMYFSITDNELNISGVSFLYTSVLNNAAVKAQTTGKYFLNCSTFVVVKMNPVLKFTKGDYTSQMINITQTSEPNDNSWQSTTSGTYMDFRNLNSVSFSLFGMYKCNGGNNYVNYFSSCKSIEFKNMNTYRVACWNSDATHYSFYFSSCKPVTFEDCYFKECTSYDSGTFFLFSSSTYSFTNCYYTIKEGKMLSAAGLSKGIASTPTIPFLVTWFCNAEVAYHPETPPKRTLPTPCPPVPKAKQPRKIKRIVTTAASAAPAVLCDLL